MLIDFNEYRGLPKITKSLIKSYIIALVRVSRNYTCLSNSDYSSWNPPLYKSEYKLANRTKLLNSATSLPVKGKEHWEQYSDFKLKFDTYHYIIPWLYWITDFNVSLIDDAFWELLHEDKPQREKIIVYALLKDTLYNADINFEFPANTNIKLFFSNWTNEEKNLYKQSITNIIDTKIYDINIINYMCYFVNNNSIQLSDNILNKILCSFNNMEQIRYYYDVYINILDKLKDINIYPATLEELNKFAQSLSRKRTRNDLQMTLLKLIIKILEKYDKNTINIHKIMAKKILN